MKKVILILATVVYALGMTSCKKAPVASFTYSPATVIVGQTVSFTDNSSNSPTSRSWDFGDGGVLGTAQTVTHYYGAAGTYNATLTASNSAGSNSTSKTITVLPIVYALSGKFNATGTTTQTTPTTIVANDAYSSNVTVNSANQITIDNVDNLGVSLTSSVSSNNLHFTNSTFTANGNTYLIDADNSTFSGTTINLNFLYQYTDIGGTIHQYQCIDVLTKQ
ncbi:MAG: hypothetical protein RL708_1630 [Bacteroidota bacterium]|jgi:PKD repeat protein